MDNHSTPHLNSDEADDDARIASQLVAYADALESTRPAASRSTLATAAPEATVLDIASLEAGSADQRSRRRRSWAIVPAAAAAAVVAGAIGWWATTRDSALVTGDPAASTESVGETDEEPPAAEEAGGDLYVLPDETSWAVSEHSEDELGAHEQGGIWVWRLDGNPIILLEAGGGGATGTRAEPELADTSEHRTILRWAEDGTDYSLQGIGLDEATLRSLADDLVPAGTGWDLPGAELIASEESGPSQTGTSEQITIVPRGADGVPVLTSRITSTVRPGSEADLYRELNEASGIGTLSEMTIGGVPGYTITGPDVSYALAAADGQVASWQTADAAVDLTSMLTTLEPVTPAEWEAAVAGIELVVAEAIAANEVGPVDDFASAELPRYTLPESWEFTWVTDMRIWTPEERAQREALHQANTVEDWPAVAAVLQGFRSTATENRYTIDVPDVVIEVWERPDEEPTEPVIDDGEPVVIGDLEGAIYPVHGGGSFGHLIDADYNVSVQAAEMTTDELLVFLDNLSLRGEDVAGGFESAGDSYQEVFLLQAPATRWPSASNGKIWHGGWDGGELGLTPGISVGNLSLAELQQWLTRSKDGNARVESELDGGVLTITTHVTAEDRIRTEQGMTVEEYEAMIAEMGPEDTEMFTIEDRASAMRYDTESNLLVDISVNGTAEQARELMDQLVEVDLDSWKTLVEPVNADPLQPR